jgi:hypothetical protein
MKFKILLILFFTSLLLVSFKPVFAIGIGAKPSSLDFNLKLGQSKETKILIYNISQLGGIFQVSSDELKDWIKIEPDNFRLEASENKEIKITILAKDDGIKATNISVLATPLDYHNFSLNIGLKIPIRLSVEKEKSIFLASLIDAFSQNQTLIIEILVIILIIGIFIRFFSIKYFKKQNKNIIPKENILPVPTESIKPNK